MPEAKSARCPVCKQAVQKPPENTWFPFCSNRCKLVDLSKWLSEEYRVPAQEADGDEAEGELEVPPKRLH